MADAGLGRGTIELVRKDRPVLERRDDEQNRVLFETERVSL